MDKKKLKNLFLFIIIHSSLMTISVATYNILSSALSKQSSYEGYNYTHIDKKARFNLLKKKLDLFIVENSIVCLQEVSTEWAGNLHVYFYTHNYIFIYIPYDAPSSGCMGVAIAFPASYGLLDTVIERPSRFVNKSKKHKEGLCQKIGNICSRTTTDTLVEIEDIASKKPNTIIMVKLAKYSADGSLEGEFWVATYHMPCAFRNQNLVSYLALNALDIIQNIVGSSPYIFCGDFNFTPDTDAYRLYTSDTQLEWRHGSFSKIVKPVKSVYMTAYGKEPECTNFQCLKNITFKGTLDYIFYSGFQVKYVEQIEPPKQLLPNNYEPSDHLYLWAVLSF